MAGESTDAWSLLGGKVSVPSELRTAEWAMVPQWLRERSFFMAGVARAEILQEFRTEVGEVAAGRRSIEESRKRLEQFLAQDGYQPEPGQEGTIKDLRTADRMLVSLRTNVALLQGWGQKERGLRAGALRAFPGWELVRVADREVPREWEERWDQVGGTFSNGRMIALKEDLIWQELGSRQNFPDAIGVDYPPLAWGSGMGWRAVPLREMKAYGLLDGWEPPTPQPVSSPNASLEMQPKISEPALREALAEELKGLATWQGATLVFTDPNGTRPYSAEQLAALWSLPLPDQFADLPGKGQMQREALIAWMGDHEDFRDANGTNKWDDLLRAAGRIKSPITERLHRGISMPASDLATFIARIEQGGYRARAEFPLESWTDSLPAAQRYASTGGKSWQIVLTVESPKQAAYIAPIARAFAAQITKQSSPPVVTESEWVYATGRRFRVLKIRRDPQTRTMEIQLEEQP